MCDSMYHAVQFLFCAFVWLSFHIVDVVLAFINIIKKCQSPKRCEPITDPLLLFSATQLADKIRKKEITSERVVKAYIKRMIEVNPVLNAIVEDRFNRAVAEAKAVDNFIQIGGHTEEELATHKPLLGVPITVKESIAVKGCLNNAGSIKATYLRPRARQDADVVRLVTDAGAIVLAVTNTPEFCINWETHNKVTGTTNNPYNTLKTTGGSSGGEAALISAAASVIGLGSDMAGSLRLPSHYCGVWSHKGTSESLSGKGHFFHSADPRFDKLFIHGPMTRYAIDLPLLLNVILKPEAREVLQLDKKVDMRDLKLFYMYESGMFVGHSVDKQIQTAIKDIIVLLQNAFKIPCTKVDMKLFKHSLRMAFTSFMDIQDIDCRFEGYENGGEFAELLKFYTCRSQCSIGSVWYFAGQRIVKGTGRFWDRMYNDSQKDLQALRDDFDSMLGTDGVFLYPIMPKTAFYHQQVYTTTVDTPYCTMFNAMGLPATAVPVGFHSNGMPMAIQVVANKNMDRLCLAVAKELEQALGGWQPPPSTKDTPIIFD